MVSMEPNMLVIQAVLPDRMTMFDPVTVSAPGAITHIVGTYPKNAVSCPGPRREEAEGNLLATKWIHIKHYRLILCVPGFD